MPVHDGEPAAWLEGLGDGVGQARLVGDAVEGVGDQDEVHALGQQGCGVARITAKPTRPAYAKPELLATGPNEVWSWDITKLKGPAKWTYFSLYVILDIFSRYVVGWMVAHREQDALARRLIEESCMKQRIEPGQLTVHADRGPSMKSNVGM